MALGTHERGFFSVLRWSSDARRDEARNIAVILVDAEGQFGGVRGAPPSGLSQDLRQQGLLDAVITGLEAQFSSEARPDLARLRELGRGLTQSLYLTDPKPTAVPDPELTLQALFKAYVSPPPTPRKVTKAVVIDRVVSGLRKRGFQVRRGEYVNDFFFDAVADTQEGMIVFDVLTFAEARKDWTPAERDAGHFLYGVEHTNLSARAVIQAPADEGSESARTAWERVVRLFDGANVPILEPETIADPQMALSFKG